MPLGFMWISYNIRRRSNSSIYGRTAMGINMGRKVRCEHNHHHDMIWYSIQLESPSYNHSIESMMVRLSIDVKHLDSMDSMIISPSWLGISGYIDPVSRTPQAQSEGICSDCPPVPEKHIENRPRCSHGAGIFASTWAIFYLFLD